MPYTYGDNRGVNEEGNPWDERIADLKRLQVNVKDYGAKGDGFTDDTAAIQAAINQAIGLGSAVVFFPKGIYIISDDLVINDGVTLRGDYGYYGYGSTIKVAANTDIHAITTDGVASFARIQDLRIDMNKQNQGVVTLGSGFRGKLDHGRITNVEVINCKTDAIYLGDPAVAAGTQTYLNIVQDCNLTAERYCIVHQYENTDSWFINNNMGGDLATSINVLISGGPTRWIGNHFNGTIQHCVVSDSDNAHFWNNLFEGSAQEAIKVTSAGFHSPELKVRWQISDNHFSNCVTDGVGAIIKFDGDLAGKISNGAIVGNLCMIGAADYFVELRDAESFSIVGNSFAEAYAEAKPINLVDTCTDIHIVGNTENSFNGTLLLNNPPIAGESWRAPTFQNSWADFGGGYRTAGYRRAADGMIELRGMIKTGAVGTTAFTLPVGYRPAQEELFETAADTVRAEIRIGTGGTVFVQAGSSSYTCLNGIRFEPA